MSTLARPFRWAGQHLNRAAIFGALLTLTVGVGLERFTLGSSVRGASYNWLFALRPTQSPTNVCIVYLDEQSHFELKQPLNAAWDRTLHARLIDRLTRAGARAIVFDIVFADHGQAETPADRALVAAAAASGRVILGANPRRDREQVEPAVDLPFDALREAAEDRWGLVEMVPDRDQVVRRMPPSYPPFKHSLGWATAMFVGAPCTRGTNEAVVEAVEREERWLNYYGPASSLPNCSYAEALDAQRTPDAFFRDRVVFVGASTLTRFSGERKDAYLTPFSGWSTRPDEIFISGVEVQATAAMNLIRGDWLRRLPDAVEWSIVVLLGLGAGYGLVVLQPRSAAVAFVLLELFLAGAAIVLFRHWQLWGAWLIGVLQVALAWMYAVASNSLRLYVQNQLLEQTVTRYVGRKLARQYVRQKNQKDHNFLMPGAQKQELTIFFSDIANFTSISEGMDSSALARHMNRYFEGAVGGCIHATDGTVVKYIGDSIFAFWNAPELQPGHAVRACEAALLFRERRPEVMNGQPLITRLGLHSGPADVGNFGSTERVDYTALGENINLASRLEGLNKHLGTLTLITQETRDLVADAFSIRPLGRFVLKGFHRIVGVHELSGRRAEATAFAARDAAFAGALAEFQAGNFEAARQGFQKVLVGVPDDGPSQFYLRAIDELQRTPPGPQWRGEVELREK